MRPLKIVFATVVTLFGSLALANDLVGWDDDVEINPKATSGTSAPSAPAKPRRSVRAASPAVAAPVTAPVPTPPKPAAPPAAAKPAPAARPATKPMSATSRAIAPQKPSAAWRTKFQCSKGYADRTDDVSDMTEQSLGFEDVYGKILYSADKKSSFQLAETPKLHQLVVNLQISNGDTPVTFQAPAYVCEKTPGVLVAVVNAGQRHNCVPLGKCLFIGNQYTVNFARPNSRKQVANSVVVSGEGLEPGVYTGTPRLAGTAQ